MGLKKITPNFLIVGTPKSGSTTMSEILKKHPEIYISSPKEPHFFSEGRYLIDHDWEWYYSLFNNVSNEKAIGEATIEYTVKYHRKWADPQLIHSNLPNAKILYLTRNPFDRIVSQYVNTKMIGHPKDMKSFNHAVKNHPLLVDTCKYWEKIEPYIKLYGEQNVKIVFFEDMQNNMINFFREIFIFLNVDPNFKINDFPNSNPTIKRKMDSTISNSIRNLVDPAKLKRILPNNLVSNIGGLLKNDFKKPEWTPELIEYVNKELHDDNQKLLNYCNKDLDYWTLK